MLYLQFGGAVPTMYIRSGALCFIFSLIVVHTPVSDVLTETSLISTPGGRHTGEMKLHLSWNNYQNTDNSKVFFVMVTDPLIDPKPSCRNHGSNPPCFVTNSTVRNAPISTCIT